MTYKFKEKHYITHSDIIDLEDDKKIKNAFKICIAEDANNEKMKIAKIIILLCQNAEEKDYWMTSLVEMQKAEF